MEDAKPCILTAFSGCRLKRAPGEEPDSSAIVRLSVELLASIANRSTGRWIECGADMTLIVGSSP
jgi:hypothetical protein